MRPHEYMESLHKQIDTFYHDGGEVYTLISGSYMQTIGHVIGNLSHNLRLNLIDLPIIGAYYLYKYDIDYFYLVKVVYGIETKKTLYTKYKIKRPLINKHPSKYEEYLINEDGVLEFVKAEQPSISKGKQEKLF